MSTLALGFWDAMKADLHSDPCDEAKITKVSMKGIVDQIIQALAGALKSTIGKGIGNGAKNIVNDKEMIFAMRNLQDAGSAIGQAVKAVLGAL